MVIVCVVRSGVELGNLSCAEEIGAEADRRTVKTVRIRFFLKSRSSVMNQVLVGVKCGPQCVPMVLPHFKTRRGREPYWRTTQGCNEQCKTRKIASLATYSAVSSTLKQTLRLLLADERRGEIHVEGVQAVGGGVFAFNPGRVAVCVWEARVVASSCEAGKGVLECILREVGAWCCGRSAFGAYIVPVFFAVRYGPNLCTRVALA